MRAGHAQRELAALAEDDDRLLALAERARLRNLLVEVCRAREGLERWPSVREGTVPVGTRSDRRLRRPSVREGTVPVGTR